MGWGIGPFDEETNPLLQTLFSMGGWQPMIWWATSTQHPGLTYPYGQFQTPLLTGEFGFSVRYYAPNAIMNSDG
jgi:hypothetical protein